MTAAIPIKATGNDKGDFYGEEKKKGKNKGNVYCQP